MPNKIDLTKDSEGREYLKVSEAAEGLEVVCDGGFSCMREGTVSKIFKAPDGTLCIPCNVGGHSLDGQLSSGGTHYVGIYKNG